MYVIIQVPNFEYVRLKLNIIINGAIIGKLKAGNGKERYFIMANREANGEPKLPRKYMNYAINNFPTEKGARGYCKRKGYEVIKSVDLSKTCRVL